MENNDIYIPSPIQTRKLMYAWRYGGNWYIETVENNDCGKYSSIALDVAGYPRIAYQDVTNSVLKYAYKDAFGWHIETVDSVMGSGFYCSLALSVTGSPGIAYKEVITDTLRFAWRDAAGWHIETADSSGRVGNCASLAYDSSGNPIIAYMDWSNMNLKVATGMPSQTGTIGGVVKDNANQPIAGVSICATPGIYCAASTTDGTYTIYEVSPGTYTVTASKAGYNSQVQSGVLVNAGQNTVVNFTLTSAPPGTVQGWVKDARGGPISGAQISSNVGGYTAQSSTDGGFSMILPPGVYSLTAVKTGFQSQTKEITVISGSTVYITFELPPVVVGTISGIVKTVFGLPLAGATVATSTGGYSATTNTDGRYEMPGVRFGIYSVTASKSGWGSQTQMNVLVSAGQSTTCNFHLKCVPRQLINGDFEGGFTNSIANGWKKFVIEGSPSFADDTTHVHSGSHAQSWWTDGSTHDCGIYQQVAVCSGAACTFSAWTWRRDAWNNGGENEVSWVGIDPAGGISPTGSSVQWSTGQFSFQKWTQQTITAIAQATTVTVFVRGRANWGGMGMVCVVDDAVLQATGDVTGSVSGFVLDSTGNPVSGALVTNGGDGYTGMSGTDGSYTLQNVSPGTYTFTASKLGFQSQSKSGVVVISGQTTACSFNLSPEYISYSTISAVKRQTDGQYISISGVVCSRRPSSSLMFVQDTDRTAGIKVTGSGLPAASPGSVCTVRGRLATNNDTREISGAEVTVISSITAPRPVSLVNSRVGGSDFFYVPGPPVSGQRGSSWGTGTNNVGLLVSTWGRVLDAPSADVFHLSDGSIPGGLPVRLMDGIKAPAIGSFCVVRGIPEPGALIVVSPTDIISY